MEGVDPARVTWGEGEFIALQAAKLGRVLPFAEFRATIAPKGGEGAGPTRRGRLRPGPERFCAEKRKIGPGMKPGRVRVAHTAGLVRPDRVPMFVRMWAQQGLLRDLRAEAETPKPAEG